jgi:mobilization protein NikA
MVRFRASEEEKEALEKAAKRSGLPLSAWIRQLSLREAGALPEAK